MTELLGSSGPKANLKYIITDELAMQYNVDGILGKASLKSLSFFYKALLDAISNCAVGPPESPMAGQGSNDKRAFYSAQITQGVGSGLIYVGPGLPGHTPHQTVLPA
ncbi:hypothetical protein ACLKA6_009044 [Drosophila palustris]